MTLRKKLLLAQAPLALSLLIVAVASRQTVVALDRNAQNVLKDNQLSVLASRQMRDTADELARLALTQANGTATTTATASTLDERRRAFDEALHFQVHNITERGEREITSRLERDWANFQAALTTVVAGATGPAEQVYFATLEPALDLVRRDASALIDLNQDAMLEKSELARRHAERHSAVLVATSLVAFLIGVFASLYLTNRWTRPLALLAAAVRRLGQGDLEVRVALDGKDEIAAVARELNTMTLRLAEYRSSSLGELLRAQRASQAAIDSLPDPVVVVRPDGELLSANQAAEALFGVNTEGPVEHAFAATPSEIVDLLRHIRDKVNTGGGSYVPKGLEEATAVPLHEGVRHVLARATSVLDERGVAVALTVLFQDVSRLRRFDQLKTDLVATVAHEFRTPLTSLRMAVHLCIEGAVGALNEKQAELLVAARQDCERLQGLVDDLLDLSRIQAGHIDLHTRSITTSSLIEHALETHRALAAERGITLALGASLDDHRVLADPERVQLVLGNLIINALRHTPTGGRVELTTVCAGEQVRFLVTDSGRGIADAHLPFLFERFYRAPDAPPGGAGLGLYICKEVVEAHGGTVGVDSAPGRGAGFWFTLPLAPETRA